MPFEAPNDIRASSDASISTGQTRRRSQRTPQLADPERIRPQAAPVDLSRGARQGNFAQLQQINDFMKGTFSLANAGLGLADEIQEQSQADGRRLASLSNASNYAAFIDEASTPEEAERRRGASPFIRQGVEEQLGSNAQAAAVTSFDAALRQRNIDLVKSGQDAISYTDNPDGYRGFVVEHFQQIGGKAGDGDVFFEMGFNENLDGHVNQILNRAQERSLDEVNQRDRDATAGLYRSAYALALDDDNLEPLSTSVLVGIETSHLLSRRPRQELVSEALTTLGAAAMQGISGPRWGRHDGDAMDALQGELLEIAGNDPAAMVQVGQIVGTARRALEAKRIDVQKVAEDANEAAAIKFTLDGFKALEEGDSEAFDVAQNGLMQANPLKAGAQLTNMQTVRESRRFAGPPSQEVVDTLSARIDAGLITSLEQLAAEEAAFVKERGLRINNTEGKLVRKRFESMAGRNGFAQNKSYQKFQRDIDGLIREVGGIAGDQLIGNVFGDLNTKEALKQKGLRDIRLRARTDVIDFATSVEGTRVRKDDPIRFEEFLSSRIDRAQQEIVASAGKDPVTHRQREFTRETVFQNAIAGAQHSQDLQDRWNFISRTRPAPKAKIEAPAAPGTPAQPSAFQGAGQSGDWARTGASGEWEGPPVYSRAQLKQQVVALSDLQAVVDLNIAYPDNEGSPTMFGRQDFGMAVHGIANSLPTEQEILDVLNSFEVVEDTDKPAPAAP